MKMTKLTGKLLMMMATLFLLAAAVNANDFMDQRRKFRAEIENKIEQKLDAEGNYYTVTFKDESGKYNFDVSGENGDRLKKYMKSYFNCQDQALIDKMAAEAGDGKYIVYKDYASDGVTLRVIFLSPHADYWDKLTDIDGIEEMFHVYNFSTGLGKPSSNTQHVILQTEGSFYGITQAVSLPVYFEWDHDKRIMSFRKSTQVEAIKAVAQLEPIVPGRTKPEEKFIDACRRHPYFQQKKGDEYMVSDKEILELYEATVTEVDERCPVKESTGHWHIQENYPYLVVDYSLKTRVNVEALLPASLRFMGGSLEGIAQTISDEVSVKYLPLSMRNFREYTRK